ncbi:conserved protein of unknown function [Pseudomonas marincola]|uniref:Uncharacterized protein n=1 Tax=Pseudomonas marincola TaxID=437900 RepID=A0A653E1L3_9PSED|nr:conserved protein of unknown function [Pseudomonas marincola]
MGLVVLRTSSDGLRCYAPLSILRVFVIIEDMSGRRYGFHGSTRDGWRGANCSTDCVTLRRYPSSGCW